MIPPIVFVATFVIVLAVATLGWLVSTPGNKGRAQVLHNVSHGIVVEENQSATSAGPSVFTLAARRMLGRGTANRLERLMARSGRPAGWTMDRLLLLKLVMPCVLAALGLLFLGSSPSAGRILLVVVVVGVGHFVPDLLLHSRGQERQQKIGEELPDTLDQMTIAVEAGLGFEAAMMRAAKNGTGPLADELGRTLQDMQLGQSRREAYMGLAERTTAPDLRRFLRAVIQADLYGIGIADVLRTQAGEMRLKRRQRAEEKAMKIPVKVIFPLMLCILPALFIVLLGPVAITIGQTFGK